jgi:hypothetical protein
MHPNRLHGFCFTFLNIQTSKHLTSNICGYAAFSFPSFVL